MFNFSSIFQNTKNFFEIKFYEIHITRYNSDLKKEKQPKEAEWHVHGSSRSFGNTKLLWKAEGVETLASVKQSTQPGFLLLLLLWSWYL